MNLLKLMLKDGRATFKPGEELEGGAFWDLEQRPERVEVRLFYYTKGRGTEDIEIVSTYEMDAADIKESRRFRFHLPYSPYSFSGKLISLIWAIEIVAKPLNQVERLEFTLSPTGTEIDIAHTVPK